MINLAYNLMKKRLVNLTFSITYRCNSRCKTCGIWMMDHHDEIGWEECVKVINRLPKTVHWVTLSGGEPSLKDGFAYILGALAGSAVKIVNIPTNGIDSEPLISAIRSFSNPKQKIIVNVSIDAIDIDDRIRGTDRAFVKADNTAQELMKLKKEKPNLRIGIHSVLSDFNKDSIFHVKKYASIIGADQWIFEPAEVRDELGNEGLIKPFDYATYLKDADIRKFSFGNRYRRKYTECLQRNSFPKCYAGEISVQIMPNGDVWPCCMKKIVIGNVKDYDYGIGALLGSNKKLQDFIDCRNCSCQLANAFYTNYARSLICG